jgi:hypothetical protein
LEELKVFMQGDYITLGHPQDGDFKNLIDAIESFIADNGQRDALETIKAAMRDDGWLRTVLNEHDQDELHGAAVRKTLEVIEQIWAFLRFVTNDSFAPDEPVGGSWQQVDDTDDVFEEISRLAFFGRMLIKYTFFLHCRLPGLNDDPQQAHPFSYFDAFNADRTLEKVYQEKLDFLEEQNKGIPCDDQLLKLRYPTESKKTTWYFRTSYFDTSGKYEFTRKGQLKKLFSVVVNLKAWKKTFSDALPPDQRTQNEHEKQYGKLLTLYDEWYALATKQIQTSYDFRTHCDRETGRKRRFGNGMHLSRLLDELKKI